MGYTTDFTGSMKLNPPASPELVKYINTFSATRRMKRDVQKLEELYKGEHGYNGSYGVDGEYFAKDDGNCGQNGDASVLNHNTPPSTQPSLWCQWIITEDGTELKWDDGEKFYEYVKWLHYIKDNFLAPNGINLDGQIDWQGEDDEDVGSIMASIANIHNPDGEVIAQCTLIKTETN